MPSLASTRLFLYHRVSLPSGLSTQQPLVLKVYGGRERPFRQPTPYWLVHSARSSVDLTATSTTPSRIVTYTDAPFETRVLDQ